MSFGVKIFKILFIPSILELSNWQRFCIKFYDFVVISNSASFNSDFMILRKKWIGNIQFKNCPQSFFDGVLYFLLYMHQLTCPFLSCIKAQSPNIARIDECIN